MTQWVSIFARRRPKTTTARAVTPGILNLGPSAAQAGGAGCGFRVHHGGAEVAEKKVISLGI